MTELVLNRMDVEEVGSNPERLAAAIHAQLGSQSGPVPVEAIARALDITAIVAQSLSNIEGALVTTPERGRGQILVNADAPPRRRRFTISHELGHFLNLWHVPTSATGFGCHRDDFRVSLRETSDREGDRHRRQEAEANAFAIELLAPRHRLRPYLSGAPDLARVLALSKAFDISGEAAARRYVECHPGPLAVVFSRDDRLLYCDASRVFPRLALRRGGPLPELPDPRPGAPLSDAGEVDAAAWLVGRSQVALTAQTLRQEGGWAMTLLGAEEPDDDEGLEDTFTRFARFER